MPSNNWCNPDNWYANDSFSKKSTTLPQNKVTDAIVINPDFLLELDVERCFNAIPYLRCNNFDIISSGVNTFSCAKLEGKVVGASGSRPPPSGISLKHWDSDTYCDWTVMALYTVNCYHNFMNIKTKIAESGNMSGLGFLSTSSTLSNCYIDSPVITLKNCRIDNNTRIICKTSGYLEDCIIDNTNKLEGIFYIKNGTSNASGIGSFTFSGSGINNGNINGESILFKDGFTNNGVLKGSSIVFSGSSTNNGEISGNPIFYGSINNSNIYGNAIFLNSSTNSGTISNNSNFFGSTNYGSVSGKSIFASGSLSSGVLNNVSFFDSSNLGFVTGNADFVNSINYGIIIGEDSRINFTSGTNDGPIIDVSSISFLNSLNNGYIYTQNKESIGEIIFTSGSNNYSDISNNFNVIFYDSGINYGSMSHVASVIFNDIAINNGSISNGPSGSTITFNKRAVNSGSIQQKYTSIFNQYTYNSSGGNVLSGVFNNFSYNAGNCIYGIFKNQSYNLENVTSGYFYNNSYNYTDCTDCKFYNNSINYGNTNIGIFYDTSVNTGQGIVSDATFNNSTKNLATTSQISRFYGSSYNSGSILDDCEAIFYDKSKNLNNIPGNRYVYFNNNSINQATVNNTHYTDYAQNQGSTKTGIFHGYSINKNLVDIGNFYNSGINLGLINISGFFYNYAINNHELTGIALNFYNYSKNKSTITGCTILTADYFVNLGKIYNNSILQFNDHTENRGIISNTRDVVFSYSSKNYGNVDINHFNYQVIFTGNMLLAEDNNNCINLGNITTSGGTVAFFNAINYGRVFNPYVYFSNSIHYGKATYCEFTNDSINSGFITTGIFNNSINYKQIESGIFSASYNFGDISIRSGSIYFSYASKNYAKISCSAIFDGASNHYFGSINGNVLFNDSSNNYSGAINGNAYFKNSSNNYGGDGYGLIQKDAKFENDSNNYYADIGGDAIFLSGCKNQYGNINGSAYFYRTTNKGNIQQSGYFYRSKHYGNINNGATFDEYSTFVGGTIQKYANFNTYSLNDKFTLIQGEALFSYSSLNNGFISGNAQFYDSSANNALIAGSGRFIDNSRNDGIISGIVILADPESYYDQSGILRYSLRPSYSCGYIFGTLSGTNYCSGSPLYTESEALLAIDYYKSGEYWDHIDNWILTVILNNDT